jgi:hypothetical protein
MHLLRAPNTFRSEILSIKSKVLGSTGSLVAGALRTQELPIRLRASLAVDLFNGLPRCMVG